MVFLKILNDTITRYQFICYTYCLLPNHYHLLIETPNGNLSLGIRALNVGYAQKLNQTYQTVIPVFQG
ncbi:MAG: transposase [Candidatus Atribacteria bacterium]|nr:transposase [Candidatus Atribacteria bacterium]